ncbi:hypothetical protein TNCV_2280001 [Trichonephila clavipes]|nr:hypothetical protein TNCV_2280001 [Trichonephila clavipes]
MQPHERLATQTHCQSEEETCYLSPPARIPRPSLRDKRKADLFVDTLEDSFQENITPYDDDHIDSGQNTDPLQYLHLTSPPLHWSTSSLCGRCRLPKPTRHPAEKQSTAPHLKRPHLHQTDPYPQRPKNPSPHIQNKNWPLHSTNKLTPTPTASSISKLPWTLRELTTCLSKQLT